MSGRKCALVTGITGQDGSYLAELLLGKVLKVSRSALIARSGDDMEPDSRREYEGLLVRRLEGAPVAYLIGTREF